MANVRMLSRMRIVLFVLLTTTVARVQTAPAQRPVMAEDVFKNITVLKGIPVDEFMNSWDSPGTVFEAGFKTDSHPIEVVVNRRDIRRQPVLQRRTLPEIDGILFQIIRDERTEAAGL